MKTPKPSTSGARSPAFSIDRPIRFEEIDDPFCSHHEIPHSDADISGLYVLSPERVASILANWPHPEVGVTLSIVEGRLSPVNDVIAGAIWGNGKLIVPGRSYTTKEWDWVGADVRAHIATYLPSAGTLRITQPY